ncbi:MAG: ATP-binding protein [Bacteroidales bacterium]|nr:ATP-binding protein [Bacteroidales bacterium]
MAIEKDTFRMLIREGQELLRDVELYDRPSDFETKGRYVLVGVRQAGKSYMLYKIAKQLLTQGHLLEEFVYIDFDDERLIEMTANDFDLILQTYKAIYPHKPILLFDEIQNIDGWEHFSRRLANQKYQVYITGSNAKMLSRDINTTLGGRYHDALIYPYSFAEYLGAQGLTLESEWMYGAKRFEVEQKFDTYLQWGGFPESLLYKNKRRWLNDVYEKILLNDIILRNKIKNEMALRLTLKRLAESVTKPIAYNRIANLIKGTGLSTSTATVIQYVSSAKDACMIVALENYASKFVEKETVKKHYFIDNGLLSIFLSDTVAPLFENVCAIHLHRQYGNKLFFYNKNIEVDFYVPDEKYAVQACVSLKDEETKAREIEALLKLDKFEPLNRMVIVTRDEEATVTTLNGKTIEVLPAWKWLLEDQAGQSALS